jgi:rubrerythrin
MPVFMEGGLQIKPQPDGSDKEGTSEMDALESAIENEYISYDFYMRSSTLLAESAARTLLGELAFEERAHAGLLLQYLAEIVKKR